MILDLPKNKRLFYSFIFAFTAVTAVWYFIISDLIKLMSFNRTSSIDGHLYNIPIFIIFITLALDFIFSIYKKELNRFELVSFSVVWLIAMIIIFERFMGNINVSGHLSSLTLMLIYGILKRLPLWMMGIILVVFIEAGFYNFYVFPKSDSGINGLCAGIGLGILLLLLYLYGQSKNRWRRS